jgi:hypothetical protein
MVKVAGAIPGTVTVMVYWPAIPERTVCTETIPELLVLRTTVPAFMGPTLLPPIEISVATKVTGTPEIGDPVGPVTRMVRGVGKTLPATPVWKFPSRIEIWGGADLLVTVSLIRYGPVPLPGTLLTTMV